MNKSVPTLLFLIIATRGIGATVIVRMMKKNFFITALCLLFLSWFTATAQELKVKSFERLDRDLLARTKERLDLNETPCAILRISVPNSDDFVFEGNIIGNPEYTTGEILVWMTNGSRNITIKSDKTGSLKFDFPDKLEQRVVYKLTLTQTKNVQMLSLSVEPNDAAVYIDDTLQTVTNGTLSILLEEGMHKYRMEHKYYHTDEGYFEIQASRATSLVKKMKPNYGVVQIDSKRNIDLITIGDNTYYDIATVTDTLFTGTYPIVAKREHLKKKLTVQLGEGNIENVKIKFRPDVFVLGNISFHQMEGPDASLYGITLGLCGIQGGYISYKYGQCFYSTGHTSSSNISGGYLRRVSKWLYLQAGIGYSENTLQDEERSGTVEADDIFIEAGTFFKLGKRFLLSLNCATGFGKNELLTFTGGIGFVL